MGHCVIVCVSFMLVDIPSGAWAGVGECDLNCIIGYVGNGRVLDHVRTIVAGAGSRMRGRRDDHVQRSSRVRIGPRAAESPIASVARSGSATACPDADAVGAPRVRR